MRGIWFWLVGRTGTSRLSRWLHPIIYRWTGGAGVAGRSLGNLTILLTTTGRRSGKPRTTAIWAYPDRDALVLVGSYGGNGHTPAWVLNLRARPEAVVQVRRAVRNVRAREAAGEEHERLWRMVVAAYPGYAAYLRWVGHAIPLMVLEPAASPPSPERLVPPRPPDDHNDQEQPDTSPSRSSGDQMATERALSRPPSPL